MRNWLISIFVVSVIFQNFGMGVIPMNEDNKSIFRDDITMDQNYLMALRSVNGFLHAWATRNYIEGPDFITDRLRETKTPEDIREFFSGISNPHHMAYEVTGYGYLNNEKIRFYIWLYDYYTGGKYETVKRPKLNYIDVMKVGEDKWLVDTWPQRCE